MATHQLKSKVRNQKHLILSHPFTSAPPSPILSLCPTSLSLSLRLSVCLFIYPPLSLTSCTGHDIENPSWLDKDEDSAKSQLSTSYESTVRVG